MFNEGAGTLEYGSVVEDGNDWCSRVDSGAVDNDDRGKILLGCWGGSRVAGAAEPWNRGDKRGEASG